MAAYCSRLDRMIIGDIISFTESRTGHKLNPDEGVQFGEAGDRKITGATVSWMATTDAIRAAGEAGHQLLISHESLFYPYDVINSQNPPKDWRSWKTNRQRSELLEKYGLTFLRLHWSVDEISIFDSFVGMLGLGKPVVAEGFAKVYEIEPRLLSALASQVKDAVGMAHLRIAAPGGMDQIVRRVGLPWGGLGLFVNVGYQQQLIELGCDVFIAGESDNYGFRFAAECGIPMIETSHEISENPGLKIFTGILAEQFPCAEFSFFEEKCVFQIF